MLSRGNLSKDLRFGFRISGFVFDLQVSGLGGAPSIDFGKISFRISVFGFRVRVRFSGFGFEFGFQALSLSISLSLSSSLSGFRGRTVHRLPHDFVEEWDLEDRRDLLACIWRAI